MPYITTIDNRTYSVDTGTNGHQRSITVDGLTHAIDWRQIAALAAEAKGNVSGGRYSLIVAGRSYEVFARSISKPDEKEFQTYEIFLDGERFEVKVEDERTKLLAGLTRAGAGVGEARVLAPMPGLVVNVLVEAGATVEQGQPVVVLEAMKMENDLPAPMEGTIKEIQVQKGQTVDQGQVLVVIEAGE